MSLLLGAGGMAFARHVVLETARARGEALFHDQAEMPAQLAGHEVHLPQVATRCSNCHEALTVAPATAAPAEAKRIADAVPTSGASKAARSYASALDRLSLEQVRARHGGPASRFDAASLCTLLRTGVDPAQVLIPPTMPRYQPTDAQCVDLWAYLMTR